MASLLPKSSSKLFRILYPSSRLVNSNVPLENALFLKFTCKEWDNLALFANPNANFFAANPDDIYSGMADSVTGSFLGTIMIPAPKQIQSMTKIKYVDDTNIVQGTVNAAGQVGGVITDLALSLLPGPLKLLGLANSVGGKVREMYTGRRDLDSTDSMFHSAEKRVYNLTFTLIATNTQEARDVATISNLFQALSLPSKQNSFGINIGALYSDKAYPPPLWRFGVGLGLGGAVDISWLGQPNFCVLQSVIINTTAAGSPYMVTDEEMGAKPMMTSFSLMFIDYEPAYRTGDTFRVVPRSASNNVEGYK